jgi:hypothetical protein
LEKYSKTFENSFRRMRKIKAHLLYSSRTERGGIRKRRGTGKGVYALVIETNKDVTEVF